GLPTQSAYTLYIYSQSDASGRELSVTVDGTKYTTTPSASPTNFIAGQNPLAIKCWPDCGGTLSFTYNNALGEADLNGIQLFFAFPALSIITAPTNQTVAVGGTVNLSVTPAGIGPFSYQWFNNGGRIANATNRALTFANAGVTNSGVYYVVVTNAYGMSISLPASVMVGAPLLLAWGLNSSGQLGDGTTVQQMSPESVATNVVATSAGSEHSLFLKGDGTLWAIGYNYYGQLGDGTTASRGLAEPVATNVVTVAAGENHSLYVKSDGTLWAMGYNGYGQLGDGTTTGQTSPGAVLGGSNVVAVAGGAGVSYFLKSDGTLWAIGFNGDGELGDR